MNDDVVTDMIWLCSPLVQLHEACSQFQDSRGADGISLWSPSQVLATDYYACSVSVYVFEIDSGRGLSENLLTDSVEGLPEARSS